MPNENRPVPQKGQIFIYRPQDNPEPGSVLRFNPEEVQDVGESPPTSPNNRPLEPEDPIGSEDIQFQPEPAQPESTQPEPAQPEPTQSEPTEPEPPKSEPTQPGPKRYLFALVLGDFLPKKGPKAPEWVACLLIDGGLKQVTPPTSPSTTHPPTPHGSGNMSRRTKGNKPRKSKGNKPRKTKGNKPRKTKGNKPRKTKGNKPRKTKDSRPRQNSEPLSSSIPRLLALDDPYISALRQNGAATVVWVGAVRRRHLFPISDYVPNAHMVMARDSTRIHVWLDRIGRANRYRIRVAINGVCYYFWVN